jgi:hypothetical protein
MIPTLMLRDWAEAGMSTSAVAAINITIADSRMVGRGCIAFMTLPLWLLVLTVG